MPFGSSTNGVMGGGKMFSSFCPIPSGRAFYILPAARGDRFLSDGVTGGGRKIHGCNHARPAQQDCAASCCGSGSTDSGGGAGSVNLQTCEGCG